MKIQNKKLPLAKVVLNKVALTQGISVDSIVGVVALTAAIDDNLNAFNKAQKALIGVYGLESNTQGFVDWSTHEKADEISDKWKELNEKEVFIETSFEDKHLYAKLSAGLLVPEVMILKEVLV
jgi:hypothetical protein